ncbi:MAG: recombination mediator RecR [Gemmatimonadota bacterium]|jgi:recombination protein RecR
MSAIDGLVQEFSRLPGVGRKTAQRLTYYLLKAPPADARRLAAAIDRVVDEVRACGECGNLSSEDPCELCCNGRRDPGEICVVEEASDIAAIEASGRFRGRYHVLGGHLSPLDGIGPDELNMSSLMRRLERGVSELIIATNPSVEGEATAAYLHRLSSGLPNLRVTRLARGLPVGGDLEFADGVTIAEAFAGRREM